MKNSNSENIGYLNFKRAKMIDKKNDMIMRVRNTKPVANRKRDKLNKRIDKKLEEIDLICNKIRKEIKTKKKDGSWENQIDSML